MTAENRRSSLTASASSYPFNEAAADDRGKPAARSRPPRAPPRTFNEAAADDRGKPSGSSRTRSRRRPLQ